jgi:hypothetical protein
MAYEYQVAVEAARMIQDFVRIQSKTSAQVRVMAAWPRRWRSRISCNASVLYEQF